MKKYSDEEKKELADDSSSLKYKLKGYIIIKSKSTIHGPEHIITSENWLIRSIWIILMIAAFILTLYYLVENVNNYMQFQTKTSTSKVFELPMTFPTITICNVNFLNEYRASNYISSKMNSASCFQNLDGNLFLSCFNLASNTNFTTISGAYDYFDMVLKRIMAADTQLSSTDRMNYGYLLNEMLISCHYDGANCYESNFTYNWSNEYGNCYTFNNQTDPLKTNAIGEKYGLHLEMVLTPPVFRLDFSSITGLYINIHNQSEIPSMYTKGVKVQTGFKTYISIDREMMQKQNHPYSDCTDDLSLVNNAYANVLYSYMNDLNVTTYKQDFCYSMCYQDKLVKNCSCSDIDGPLIDSSIFCSSPTEIQCLLDFDAFYGQADIVDLCSNACPQQCTLIDLNLQAYSFMAYPVTSYISNLQSNNVTSKFFPNDSSGLVEFGRQALLKLIISYENRYFNFLEESPALSTFDFFGNLGGQVGLYMGMSMISVFEIIMFFVEMFVLICKHLKLKKAKIMPQK